MDKGELAAFDDEMLGAWNNRDVDTFVDGLTDDIVWRDVSLEESLHGKEAATEYFQGWMTAFPDFSATPVYRAIGDDSVAAEVLFAGTNTGPMEMGGQTIPPTGKTVSAKGSLLCDRSRREAGRDAHVPRPDGNDDAVGPRRLTISAGHGPMRG